MITKMTKQALVKKLLVFTLIAAFAGFAWLSLPSPEQAPRAGQQITGGSGVVQHIDNDKGMVTITHGPLPALNMMAMTMTYAVRDKNQLVNLQPARKVDFQIRYDGQDYLITNIK